MEPLLTRHTASWRVALGSLLIVLITAFMIAVLLIFPYKASANAARPSEFIYDILGSLDYQADGRFRPVEDTGLQTKLQQLISQHQLNGLDAEAYIVNRQTQTVVWQAAPANYLFDTRELVKTYDLTQLNVDHYALVIQNFWLTHQDMRHEFQLVVATIAQVS